MSDAVANGARLRGLSLAALAGAGGVFARDIRFALPGERPAAPDTPAPDPVAAAHARGYAEGAEAGANIVRAEAAAADAARHRIETALMRMDTAETAAFVDRLKDTVLALCHTVLADAAPVPEALVRRVHTAAAMFNRASDDRIIRLHPEDLALIHARLPEHWHCEPDPALERGTVRVETAGGGVEDGPAQWRAALDEALRTW
jgi:flagellar assembly protein FliH